MANLLGIVEELFDHPRGVVVVVEQPVAKREYPAQIGDPIEFVVDGTPVLRSVIHGIEHANPNVTRILFSFMLPRDVQIAEVPRLAEVWKLGGPAA